MASAPGETRVLLVEDHPVNQKVVSRMLERLSCRVTVAEDGLSGVQQAQDGYDLILMDCSMPRMDGFEATRRIRSMMGAVSGTPIVALTAHATAGDRDLCLAAGMNAWIPKPVSQDQLAEALRDHTQWSRQPSVPPEVTIDVDTVDALLLLGGPDDPDFFDSLVGEFARTAAATIQALKGLGKAQDIVAFRRTAHRFVGSAGTIGATRAREVSVQLENAEAGDLPERANDWIASLDREVARAVDQLSRRSGRAAGAAG